MAIALDFSALSGVDHGYELRVRVTAAGGRSTQFLVPVGPHAEPEQVANAVRLALPKVVDACVDGAVLVLMSFDGAALEAAGAEAA